MITEFKMSLTAAIIIIVALIIFRVAYAKTCILEKDESDLLKTRPRYPKGAMILAGIIMLSFVMIIVSLIIGVWKL